MSRIIINITDDLDQIPNVEELLHQEIAASAKLKEEGIMEHLFVKNDRTGAVLVFDNIDLAKAKELVAGLPMAKHFDEVEYIVADKQF